jgi:signal transduction histidine kinase
MAGAAMPAATTHALLVSRGRLISFAMITMSVVITGVLSFVFYREVRGPMLLTGLICAVIVDRIVYKITRGYRQKLRAAHDLLEQRVRERTAALEQANHELLVRDRMATAGMLAAGVSHEIRSPLMVIQIGVEEIADQLAHEPIEVREQLRDMQDAAQRIELILRDLSSLASPPDDPIVATDLGEVIATAARLASYRFSKHIILERDPVIVPPIAGNASRLVQVVLNLLVNAARATRDGTTNRIKIATAQQGDRVIVDVADSGTGISPEAQARLFEPFYTTGKQSGGTGLGLVISRSIVERMGGTLAIASTPGVGTTATISLRVA